MIELEHVGRCDRIDELAEEFVECLRRGESPSVAEFASRCPDASEEVGHLLASIILIEQWKQHAEQAQGRGPRTIVPEQLGDYQVLRELGRGGMGIVYEAAQISLGRHVALKVLPRHSRLDHNRLKRFQREAQAAARLHHTNIVQVFGVGEHEGLHYIVMQRIEGRGLDQVLGDWKREAVAPSLAGLQPDGKESVSPLQGEAHWGRIARIGIQVADALQYAHNQGVLHRDIKPANLMLDRSEVVWVTDFGLARFAEDERLSNSGDLVGTLQYLAPERFETEADARSDIYSLGLTLYELLTGEPAFQTSSSSRLIQSVSCGQPDRPRKRNPAIPLDLETIVLKSIAREPAHRYATAGELADDLRRFLNDQPVLARRTSSIERLARWCRHNRAITALSGAAVGLLVLVAVVGWVGYVSTTRALERESIRRGEAEKATRRVEDNVALSLEAIETFLQQLALHDFSPPSFSRPGVPRTVSPVGPRPAGKSVFSATSGFVWGNRASPLDAGMLESVLGFYDRFAAANTTNQRLKREAAMASRRVGDIQRQLGREGEANLAYRRAAELFELLLANDPASAELRYTLADTYATSVTMSSDPMVLDRQVRMLLRAEALISDPLGPEADTMPRAPLLSRILVELGELLGPLGRTEEAEVYLCRGVELQRVLNERRAALPRSSHVPMTTARQALANFVGARGEKTHARALLSECCSDLDRVATAEASSWASWRFLALRYESLAESLSRVGDQAMADEVATRARRVRRPRPAGFNRNPVRSTGQPDGRELRMRSGLGISNSSSAEPVEGSKRAEPPAAEKP